MRSMMMTTAIRKAKDGEFEFIYDAKVGHNEVKYQTPSGRWLHKTIFITKDDCHSAKKKFWVYRVANNNPDTAVRMASFEDTSVGYKAAIEWRDKLNQDPEAKKLNFDYCVIYE